MSSYLITGTSRGLGLELVRELAQQGSSKARLVFATSRSRSPSSALQEIIDKAPHRVKHVHLDVTSQSSIDQAVNDVSEILGSGGLDVLVNNAGITKAEIGAWKGLTSETLLNLFSTNVAAVHNVTQAFLPLLEQGKDKKLINISSTMGSIGITLANPDFFKSMPTSAYNISKAALNSLTVQYAIGLKEKGYTVLSISPGNLQTELGGAGAPLTANQGAKATLDIIQTATAEDSGRFRNIFVEGDKLHDGKDPVW